METPYRHTEPLHVHALRTSRWRVLGTIVIAVLTAGAILVFFLPVLLTAIKQQTALLGFVLGLAVVSAGLVLSTLRARLVRGGQGALRIFPDRVEVPRAIDASQMVLELASLQAFVHETQTTFLMFPLPLMARRSRVLVLRAGGLTRMLSAELFESEEAMHQAHAQILRAQRARLAGREEDEYDALIDDELRELDH